MFLVPPFLKKPLPLYKQPRIAERLNEIKHFFLSTSPKVTLEIEGALTKFGGSQNLFIDELPKSLYEQMPYLNVDFAVCLTKYPIAFGQQNSINYNYFSRPSSVDERFDRSPLVGCGKVLSNQPTSTLRKGYS